MQQLPMTEDQFHYHWDSLKIAIRTLLVLKPGKYPPVSYEQTYSLVYKCVAHGYASLLHDKLIAEVGDRLQLISQELSNSSDASLPVSFNEIWCQYTCALQGIVPIFNYMNRFYLESRLNRNLKTELLALFDRDVLQPHLKRLVAVLSSAQSVPMAIMPNVVENLVKMIYELRPETAHVNLPLFQRFIPGLWHPLSVHNITDMMLEAKEMSSRIQSAMAFQQPSSNGSLKRSFDDNKGSVKVFACEDGISHY